MNTLNMPPYSYRDGYRDPIEEPFPYWVEVKTDRAIYYVTQGITSLTPRLTNWLNENTGKNGDDWICIARSRERSGMTTILFRDESAAAYFALVWSGESDD